MLRRILDDDAMRERAEAIGRAIRSEPDGALTACEQIERMVHERSG